MNKPENELEQRQLINNSLDYYYNNSITKYDLINLIILILNNKIDPNKTIIENLDQFNN